MLLIILYNNIVANDVYNRSSAELVIIMLLNRFLDFSHPYVLL